MALWPDPTRGGGRRRRRRQTTSATLNSTKIMYSGQGQDWKSPVGAALGKEANYSLTTRISELIGLLWLSVCCLLVPIERSACSHGTLSLYGFTYKSKSVSGSESSYATLSHSILARSLYFSLPHTKAHTHTPAYFLLNPA